MPQPPQRIMLLSGVALHADRRHSNLEAPVPDYGVLLEAFEPDVLAMTERHTMMNPFLWVIEWLLGPQWVIALIAYWRRRRYAAIVALAEDVGLPLAVIMRCMRARTPLILTCHNIATRKPTFYLRWLGADTAVSVFQCLSQKQAALLKARSRASVDRIQMIYWHVDHRFYQPIPAVPVKPQICSAGMACRDYATLVAATRDLNVDVKIAADSTWYRQALNLDAGDLPPHVEMRSYGTTTNLRQLYAESLFVVVPLLEAPFAAGYSVILEAMAMGKAVIVSDTSHGDDFVIDGWNGFQVPVGDQAALRDRIAYLLAHPDEAGAMGRRGRQLVEVHLTLDHYREQVRYAVTMAVSGGRLLDHNRDPQLLKIP